MKKYIRLIQLVLIYFSILLLYYLIQKDFTKSSGNEIFESSKNEVSESGGSMIPETIVQNFSTLDGEYQVHSVVDGDTIKVIMQGKNTTIRILGIDTPEIYTTRTGYPECYGQEASDFAKRTLSGAIVRLEGDATQDKKDKYGRVLAHVFFSGGLYYQEESIKKGYGFRYVYRKPTKYDNRLQEAEREAKIQNVGVWAKCGGVRRVEK
ncbi:MAG: thermonuclease family protein [Candidatus Gracilibacteria bacterium]|nr:thermonuclease family protein [Candidatus Gracilibacteria bacterium]